ncbi:Uma2 family endonuclease [Desulfurivibrio alkaliphilus]|uniref:Putative restriction endonuclease domain-containing protein n=1 Tax=Desulfurivibrio alkaliphilus (strain DSM 19089 / UNIQEM U267 / AHT2) TaxID=589865 RepID=D6Z3I0_DESAT|nr:Uma2 family endonuclease [Desulfurivibrio alkaliphilus]ADH86105.1 protein of unknown function DUF820 [Desulfurivibrio alkaliphilus AHT 2]
MGQAQPLQLMTAAEYLQWEPPQQEKHEFIGGELYAMGGASRRHVTVTGNLFAELDRALEGTPCRVYMADMWLQVVADEVYFYPDVMVTCDSADHRAEQYMCSPIFLAEVLSPSNEIFDRKEKASYYRRLPSLQEFLFIDPDRRSMELYRRNQAGLWELRDFIADQPLPHSLPLASLELEIARERIFRNVD